MKFKNSLVWLLSLLLFFFGGLKSTAQYYKIDTSFHFEKSPEMKSLSLVVLTKELPNGNIIVGRSKYPNFPFLKPEELSLYTSKGILIKSTIVDIAYLIGETRDKLYFGVNENFYAIDDSLNIKRIPINGRIASLNPNSKQYVIRNDTGYLLKKLDSDFERPVELNSGHSIGYINNLVLSGRDSLSEGIPVNNDFYIRTKISNKPEILGKEFKIPIRFYQGLPHSRLFNHNLIEINYSTWYGSLDRNMVFLQDVFGENKIDFGDHAYSRIIGKNDSHFYVKIQKRETDTYEYYEIEKSNFKKRKMKLEGDFHTLNKINDIYIVSDKTNIYKLSPTDSFLKYTLPDTIFVNQTLEINVRVSNSSEKVELECSCDYLNENNFKPSLSGIYYFKMTTKSGLASYSEITVVKREDSILLDAQELYITQLPKTFRLQSKSGLQVALATGMDSKGIDEFTLQAPFITADWSQDLIYRYNFRTYGNDEYLPAYKTIGFTIKNFSGLLNEENAKIIAFPNPVNGSKFKIAFVQKEYVYPGFVSIKLYDSKGKEYQIDLKSIGRNILELETKRKLSSGIFRLNIETPQQQYSKTIVFE